MPGLKYFVPALAIANSVLAQSSSCSGGTTISNAAGASQLGACTTYSGDVTIASSTPGDINLGSVEAIVGDLVGDGASNMTSLTASMLERITGNFSLQQVQGITALNFAQLTTVGGINWITIPNLNALAFSSTGVQEVGSLTISDTGLGNLDGINLQTAASVIISNNNQLNRVQMQLANVTNMLQIIANGNDQLSLLLPNLIWANNIDIQNCQTIQINSLHVVNSSATFNLNNGLETLSAPNLTMVGLLTMDSNPDLSNISFPALTQATSGTISITNNGNLTGNISFPQLTTVRGDFRLLGGNWDGLSLPKINLVSSGMSLSSTEDLGPVCAQYSQLSGSNNVIKAKVNCTGSAASSASYATGTDATGSAATATGTNAALGRVGVSAASVVGFSGLLAAMLGML